MCKVRASAIITPVMMLDSPHTSVPMLMRGNALVLKTPVENAPRTSIEKHLSWSPDIFEGTDMSTSMVNSRDKTMGSTGWRRTEKLARQLTETAVEVV
jgi:hypothetical protein